jgi:hypothetical protein
MHGATIKVRNVCVYIKPKNLYVAMTLRSNHSVFHYYTLTIWHFSTTPYTNPLKRQFYIYRTVLVANNFGYGLGTPSEDKTLVEFYKFNYSISPQRTYTARSKFAYDDQERKVLQI